MYLVASTFIFYIDWEFSLPHMSKDVSSFLHALSSHGVPSVNKITILVKLPQGSTLDLAGPEPSAPFIDPGQHLHRYLAGSAITRDNAQSRKVHPQSALNL